MITPRPTLTVRATILILSTLSIVALPAAAQRAQKLQQSYVDTLPLTKRLGTKGSLGGLCVDESGTIFVANFRGALWSVSPFGDVRVLSTGFAAASGNSIAPDGRLIQSDFGTNRVYSINKSTGAKTILMSRGLNGPVGVVVAPSGEIFVANCNGQNIRRGAPGSTQTSVFASSPLFSCPNGISMGPTGDLFVTNFFDDNLLRVDPFGGVSVFATVGTLGLGGAHLVFVGDTLYVSKIKSHDIYRVSMSGDVELVAGREGQPGLSNGAASHARLRYPNGLGADPSGRMLYTNNLWGKRSSTASGEMRIRRILIP